MPSSPDQQSTGKQYEIRAVASSLELDKKLAAFTLLKMHPQLPGYLQLFSEKKFILLVNDRDPDGGSLQASQMGSFQMRITKHMQNKYELGTLSRKDSVDSGFPERLKDPSIRISLQLQLGVQAASEIMISPFFTTEERRQAIIPMYYDVPHPVSNRAASTAHTRLREYLSEKPRSNVDELMMVENAFRTRATTRTRVRESILPVKPIALVQPKDPVEEEVTTIEQVG